MEGGGVRNERKAHKRLNVVTPKIYMDFSLYWRGLRLRTSQQESEKQGHGNGQTQSGCPFLWPATRRTGTVLRVYLGGSIGGDS